MHTGSLLGIHGNRRKGKRESTVHGHRLEERFALCKAWSKVEAQPTADDEAERDACEGRKVV